jgi:hypothetical protein
MIVVLENAGYDEALGQPFLRSLAAKGALLTHFSAEAHPSQPNYIALVSGSTHDVHSDDPGTLDARHVGDLLEAKGLAWKVYVESYPGDCFLGARFDNYVQKHVPFLSFRNVSTDPARCARIVDGSKLSVDIANGTLASYSLYIPDLRNDGHDTDVAYADRWLSAKFGPLLRDPRFINGMLFVVTFDEAAHSPLLPSSNHIFTVLVGGGVDAGSRADDAYNHYSLLRLVEDQFGLGALGHKDAIAPVITGIWR